MFLSEYAYRLLALLRMESNSNIGEAYLRKGWSRVYLHGMLRCSV